MRDERERRAAGGMVVAVLAVIGAGVAAGKAQQAPDGPRRPGRDDEVVARVPARGLDAAAAERARLRRALDAAPGDLPTAARLARLFVGAARASGDPRFLGRAEGALAPWWADAETPDEVLLLRATIRQSRHEFGAALADLDRLVVRAPGDAQAHLTRAVVLGVVGRHGEALAACARLLPLASPFVVAACRAPIRGVTGEARAAAAELDAALAAGTARGGLGAAEVAWGRTLLADLALWSGDERAAEAHLRAAVAAAPDDGYARAALADLLLDQGRAAQARALTEGRNDDDGMLLRRAIAGGDAGAAAARTVAARFEAARRRGDSVHRREEARFALAVEREPARALALAAENWRVQREPADARVLLEAALAARAPDAAAPALAWLDETGAEWPRLRALAAAVRAGRAR